MASLQPFRAIHYNPGVAPLSKVLAPPYDVVSPEERERLKAASPYNVIHLILGQSHVGGGPQAEDAYTGAGASWRRWMEEGALVQDDRPAFYLYEQQFFHDGESYRRTGLAAAVEIEEYENGVIFPHEKTLPGPREDRFRLMEAVDANLDSVFGLYDEKEAGVAACLETARRAPELLRGRSPDGQTHVIRAIEDPDLVEAIRDRFAGVRIVIADGHHRYETAMAYRDARRARGDASPEAGRVMMTLCPIQDPGLLVLPTHRLVSAGEGVQPGSEPGEAMSRVVGVSLGHLFSVEGIGSGNHAIDRLRTLACDGRMAYGAYFGEGLASILYPKDPARHRYEEVTHLSEQILDRLPSILEVPEIRIDYTHSSAEAICQVNAGNAWIAFLLQGVPARDVFDAALGGHLMPEKSTFFSPKLQSGLLMRACS